VGQEKVGQDPERVEEGWGDEKKKKSREGEDIYTQ
jgi:hypothetical protein